MTTLMMMTVLSYKFTSVVHSIFVETSWIDVLAASSKTAESTAHFRIREKSRENPEPTRLSIHYNGTSLLLP